MDDVSTKPPTKNSNVVTRSIAGETIIVPIRGHMRDLGSIFTLNEVGTLVWELIDGRTNISQIVEAICGHYDGEPEQVKEDVLAFLGDLKTEGLIQLFEESQD